MEQMPTNILPLLEKILTNQAEMKLRFDQMDQRFDQIEARLGRLETKFDDFDARLKKIERKWELTVSDVIDLKEEVQELKKAIPPVQ
jgi:predicted  nucleic acid-binding Zn-ribbon protein